MTNKMQQTWEGCYPLIIYVALTEMVATLVKNYTPLGAYSNMLVQSVAKLVCIFAMFYFYKKAPKISGRIKHFASTILILILLGILFSVAFNYLVDVSPLKAMSPTYKEISKEIYSDKQLYQLISAGLLAPVLEEITFRGILMGNLHKAFGKWVSILVSAVIFGAFHFNMVQFAYAAALGVVLGIVYDKCGQLISCILLHASANVFALMVTWYGLDKYMAQTTMMELIVGCVCLVAGTIILVKWKRP